MTVLMIGHSPHQMSRTTSCYKQTLFTMGFTIQCVKIKTIAQLNFRPIAFKANKTLGSTLQHFKTICHFVSNQLSKENARNMSTLCLFIDDLLSCLHIFPPSHTKLCSDHYKEIINSLTQLTLPLVGVRVGVGSHPGLIERAEAPV